MRVILNRNSAPKYREVSGFKDPKEDCFKDVDSALRDYLFLTDLKFRTASARASRIAAALNARRSS